MGFLIELLWSAPVVVLILLLRRRAAILRKPGWMIPIGTVIGAFYAVIIALIAGPMVQAVIVPFLPLVMTVAALAGAIPFYDRTSLRTTTSTAALCLVALVVTWGAFFALRSTLAESESLRLVVVKVTPGSQGLSWVRNGGFVFINHAEMDAVENAAKPIWSGVLTPVFSLAQGEGGKATAILVMQHDVLRYVRLPLPKQGVVVYVQMADGSWQGGNKDVTGRSLFLSPDQTNGFTRIKIDGLIGSQTTEVGVSHR